MKKSIASLLLGTALAVTTAGAAFAQDKTVKIGALSDQSGLYADLGGPGSTLAAQMAVEDSGLAAKGWKIDIISGDHQNKPDIGTAIARILRTGASFLMLDEPTEGLAPVIIQQIGHTIARLKKEGFTILLVEQNFRFASTVADRYYVVEHGKIIDGFSNSELAANMDKLHTYLGV